MKTPDQMWDDFVKHLNKQQPLGAGKPHQNFLGSIAKYRTVFMEANETTNEQESA
jgi:hypothetical protein